jgi:hypothetical protein
VRSSSRLVSWWVPMPARVLALDDPAPRQAAVNDFDGRRFLERRRCYARWPRAGQVPLEGDMQSAP